MKLIGLIICCLSVTTSVLAQQVRIDVKNSQGKAETYTFPLGGVQEWNTTFEQKFKSTDGDCSMVDTSKFKTSVRVGRVVGIRGFSLDKESAIIDFRYSNVSLTEVSPFKFNSSCILNQPTSKEVTFDGATVLKKNKPQVVSSASDDPESVTFTLVD